MCAQEDEELEFDREDLDDLNLSIVHSESNIYSSVTKKVRSPGLKLNVSKLN